MGNHPARRRVVLDHSGAVVSSATTSRAIFTGDYTQIALSVQTVTTFASRITVQGTNADGFTASIGDTEWSTLTALTGSGLGGQQVVVIDPGMRWTRVASASSCTVILSGRIG